MCMYNLHALDSLELHDHRCGSSDEEPPLQADPGAESALPCPTEATAHWNTTYNVHVYTVQAHRNTHVHVHLLSVPSFQT